MRLDTEDQRALILMILERLQFTGADADLQMAARVAALKQATKVAPLEKRKP